MTDLSFIVRVAVITVSFLAVTVVCTLLGGLFNPAVDNKQIFEVLGPMAREIVGVLIMLVGGITSYYLTKPAISKEGPSP